jgi:hypothetical protein
MLNITAIVTLVAAALISATVFELLPAGAEEARMFTALGITFIAGVIAELIGLAPRLLYLIPLWMAALIMLGVQIHERHGILGVLGALVGGAALQALMIVVARFHERRRERRDLDKRLRSVDLRHLNPAYDQAWDIVHEAVLVPRVTPWTRELLAHDHKVAALVERWLTDRHPGLPAGDRLRRLVAAFEAGAAAPGKAAALGLRKESEWLQALIRNRDSLASDPKRPA